MAILRPVDVRPTLNALSPIRLGNYKTYFNTVDDYDLYGCYQWNGELSRSFLPIIHLLEITLRNAYHRELSRHHSVIVQNNRVDSFEWYNHVKLTNHSAGSIRNTLRSRNKPDDVISKQTFGFWTNILSESVTPWGTVLKNIFPNVTRNWAHRSNRDWLEARKLVINDLRNRIAHWEPIWKLPDLMEERILRPRAAPLKVMSPAPTNAEQSIARLRMYHDRIVALLHAVDPDLSGSYLDSYTNEHFLWVCSEAGLASFRACERRIEVSASIGRRDLLRFMRGKTIVTVVNGGQRMRLYPMGA